MISLLDLLGSLASFAAVLLLLTSWRQHLCTEEKWIVVVICSMTALVNGLSFWHWLGHHMGADLAENWSDYLQIIQPVLWGMFFYVVVQSAQRRALEASRQQMRDLVENMPVILHAFDEHGHILAWNRHAEEVSGYTKEEVIGDSDILRRLFPDAAYRDQLLAECRNHGAA